eukprot:m.81920 g.81920  ORF g.81920 m.81920 type:complete len:54 (-) comp12658_c1_seq1:462-623(-)
MAQATVASSNRTWLVFIVQRLVTVQIYGMHIHADTKHQAQRLEKSVNLGVAQW